MKKLFILFAILMAGKSAFAQDENNLKNFRFGLKFAPSFNWMRPDDKKTDGAGTVAGIKYGLITEFRLNSVASFATGIEGSHLGGKLTYTDSAFYMVHDDAFLALEDTAGKTGIQSYLLSDRTFRMTYVTIPLTLKLKTKDIGGMTYFGMFGGDLNFRAGAKATDTKKTNLVVPSGSAFDATKVENSKDMNIFAVNLNVGAGLEYNLSGTTSLMGSIGYNRGFLSNTKTDSEYLLKPNYTAYRQKAFLDGIVITLGVLF